MSEHEEFYNISEELIRIKKAPLEKIKPARESWTQKRLRTPDMASMRIHVKFIFMFEVLFWSFPQLWKAKMSHLRLWSVATLYGKAHLLVRDHGNAGVDSRRWHGNRTLRPREKRGKRSFDGWERSRLKVEMKHFVPKRDCANIFLTWSLLP